MSGWLEKLMWHSLLLKVFITIFTVGSLICVIAPNFNIMLFGHLIQGIGGGPMTPISQSILLAAFLLIPLAFYLNVDTDPGGGGG